MFPLPQTCLFFRPQTKSNNKKKTGVSRWGYPLSLSLFFFFFPLPLLTTWVFFLSSSLSSLILQYHKAAGAILLLSLSGLFLGLKLAESTVKCEMFSLASRLVDPSEGSEWPKRVIKSWAEPLLYRLIHKTAGCSLQAVEGQVGTTH